MCLDGTNLFIYGGFVNGVRQNDLHVYNFNTKEWICLYEQHPYDEIEPSKEFPVPRSGQAMAVANGKAIVFGGRNDYSDMLDDTWEFDILSKWWTLVDCDPSPVGRANCTLTVDGSRMILFGGIVEITKEINELHQYQNSGWSSIDDESSHTGEVDRSPSPARWRKEEPIGEMYPTQMDKTAPVGNQSPSKLRDRNFFLPKEIPKQKKKGVSKKKQEKYDEMRTGLSTPTTENLRNTFVIKNSGESFDAYHN